MRRLLPTLVPLLLVVALLAETWRQRRDPLDLGVVVAGLVGLALLWPAVREGGSQARLAARGLVALVAGVALFGVREPGSALGFAAVLVATQLVVGRLLRRR
ncbi:hypothetical protein DAETH_27470 [Deinococcus aetherius]|uniref:Uncharacterized protein n=1 Tax=Deinococcus aetherius TaxID=200252 RepID=A0ABN6RHH1_9DEIO|nr:hypothetical protein [Deinococcus aetherius]BDP42778.1 hypothetical protein DAETH_27470 [Deinococcus aetherius]